MSRPAGGLPCFAPLVTDPQHAAGVNLPGAWDQGVAGRDDVLIAYIEGGVNYISDGIKDGLDAVWLNTCELPYLERPDGTSYPAYDADGNGRVDVRDYVGDPRVNPACATYAPHVDVEGTTRSCLPGGQHDYLNRVTIGGTKTVYLSPEDLIAVFGHCRITDHQLAGCPVGGRFDNDGNGYPGDVSGWNAYRGTNDPQTEDLAYNHAPGLISLLGGQPDNGYSSVGVCSKCRVLPVKQGGECLGRTDVWAQALTYAVDAGAKVISSVVVSYTYSKANQEAVDNAYRHGVVLSLDSNDFDAMDHTDGMLLDHVMPGNSLTENAPAASAVRTFRARSNVTSYGTHNVFSGGKTTTSGATPFQAGMFAMVVSAGRDAVDRGTLRAPLTPDEVKQVLMDSSSAVVPQTQEDPVTAATQWPGNADSVTDATHTNWSTQYGYGRPDVGAAVQRVLAGRLPAHAEITSPKWFSYIDPARQTVLGVDGVITRSPTQGTGQVHYVLEWATGADPKDSDFHTASEGDTADLAGHLGDVDLTQVPPRSMTGHRVAPCSRPVPSSSRSRCGFGWSHRTASRQRTGAPSACATTRRCRASRRGTCNAASRGRPRAPTSRPSASSTWSCPPTTARCTPTGRTAARCRASRCTPTSCVTSTRSTMPRPSTRRATARTPPCATSWSPSAAVSLSATCSTMVAWRCSPPASRAPSTRGTPTAGGWRASPGT